MLLVSGIPYFAPGSVFVLQIGACLTMNDGDAMCWRRCTEVECGPVAHFPDC